MIVELDPINVVDLVDGSVVIYTPADGAGVVAVLSIDGDPVSPDFSGQIGFATDALPQVFAQTAGNTVESFTQTIYNPFATDPIRAGLTFGSRLGEPWAAGHAYDGSVLQELVFGAGHYWTTADAGTSDTVEPDWASAFGGSIVDNGITWDDGGELASGGSITVALEVQAATASAAGDAYADVDELARILKIRNPTADQLVALERVLVAAANEIDHELDRDTDDPLPIPPPALVVQVNLDRAEELWQQTEATLGFVGLGSEAGPSRIALDTWAKHAKKLIPWKANYGLA